MLTLPEPRPYAGIADFTAMGRVLSLGRLGGAPAHYVHVGDLAWWLFYLNQDFPLAGHCFLWDDPAGPTPRGWALLSPHYGAFDVYARPDQWESGTAAAMFVWAETQMAQRMVAAGRDRICTMWVAEDDRRLRAHLARRGFVQATYAIVHTEQPLSAQPQPVLPPGYTVRQVGGPEEAEARAAAQHAAFGSWLPLDIYWPRYLHLMRSPVYRPDLDIIVAAPDGRVAAFCMGWLDLQTRVGLLEPVGVHPDFQRRGLGRAVVQAALHRLYACGMQTACVGFEPDNAAARALYLATGFAVRYRILSYELALPGKDAGDESPNTGITPHADSGDRA